MNRRLFVLIAVFLGLGLCLTPFYIQSQTIWHVDDDAPGDPGPGDPSVSDPQEDGSSAHPFDAIQEGIDAWRNGDVQGFDEYDREFRAKNGISADA